MKYIRKFEEEEWLDIEELFVKYLETFFKDSINGKNGVYYFTNTQIIFTINDYMEIFNDLINKFDAIIRYVDYGSENNDPFFEIRVTDENINKNLDSIKAKVEGTKFDLL